VGELNVDIILHNLRVFPEVGREVLCENMVMTLGSSSAIFARNIASLGAKVAFLGKTGKDEFGEYVIQELKKKDIDVSMIVRDKRLKTGATVVLAVLEDRANITYPGAMDHLTIKDISEDKLRNARHLHFSSCFMQPGIKEDLGEMFRMAKKSGLTTSFDMQWDPYGRWELKNEEILPYVDIFLPNEKELLALTAKKNIADAIDSIKGLVKTMIVKRGRRGCLLYYQNRISEFSAYLNEQVVDTVGAGDSFNAGFIFKYIRHAGIEECVRYGNLMGAISTTAAGGVKAFEDYEYIVRTAQERFGVQIG
jgi:sugar/nucleoside kinase (ribokinase family)